MSDSSTSITDRHSPADASLRGTIGILLVRLVVPLWVLAGALFKLWERNPKLLPEPVRNVSLWIAQQLKIPSDDLGTFLDHTLRFLIGTELALVLVMFLIPKLARLAAIFTLLVFIAVLTGVVLAGGADCGCFGSAGPPPWAMLAIDAGLLIGVFLCRPSPVPSKGALAALGLGGAAASFAAAFLVPNPTIVIPQAPAPRTTPVEQGISETTRPAANLAITTTAASPWPDPPTPRPTYFFRDIAEWEGRPLREIELAQLISRPLPEGFDAGPWFVVFYRGDCDVCHSLLEDHLASKARRTVAVKVVEQDAGPEKPLPEAPFHLHTLPLGPNYVFTTPLLLGVVDGTVVATCQDPKKQDDLARVLKLADAGGAAVASDKPATAPAAAVPSPPATGASPATSAPATPATVSSWPAPPAPRTTYFPQFQEWKGQRLDAQGLALQMRTPEFDLGRLNSGRWHVLFYRADCEHCHELMELYLVGPLEERVVAIQVPDTDPSQDLGMPLTSAILGSLPAGPNYVFSTPVLLTVVDGTIVGLALDSQNDAEVTACLEAK